MNLGDLSEQLLRLSPSSRPDVPNALHKSVDGLERILDQVKILQVILDSLADGIALADANGTLLYLNPAGEEMIGKGLMRLPPSEWSRAYGCYRPDGITPFPPDELPLARALKAEKVENAEVVIRNEARPQGVILQVNAVPIRDAEGKLLGGAAVFRDITERRRIEKDLLSKTAELAYARAEREQLELFAHLASHDLQEPLQKIIGFGDLLEERSARELGPKGLEFLNHMRDGALRMAYLMDALSQFARHGLNGRKFETVDLGKVAREVLEDLELRLKKTGGHVEVGPLPVLEADPLQMRELFQNLVSNALKFHKPHKPPFVRVSGGTSPEGNAVIAVEDDGIGFDPAYVDIIFRPFERLCRHDEFEGTGIGLAICHKIVLRHKGTITAKTAPGKGTLFTVTLPLTQEVGEAPA